MLITVTVMMGTRKRFLFQSSNLRHTGSNLSLKIKIRITSPHQQQTFHNKLTIQSLKFFIIPPSQVPQHHQKPPSKHQPRSSRRTNPPTKSPSNHLFQASNCRTSTTCIPKKGKLHHKSVHLNNCNGLDRMAE